MFLSSSISFDPEIFCSVSLSMFGIVVVVVEFPEGICGVLFEIVDEFLFVVVVLPLVVFTDVSPWLV